MRILIVKTSSMGDVIHTLPALTDAGRAIPGIKFDWLVEENFAEIPHWHPLVDKVIPVALRRWRKNLFAKKTHNEWLACRQQLRTTHYDLIIDAQGLLKSAWLLFVAKGKRCGLDWQSAREPLASLFYQRKVTAGKLKEVHAVTRMRRLFSQALGYELLDPVPDYGIDRRTLLSSEETSSPENFMVFLHGTTWATKHWPEKYWIELANRVNQKGYGVKLLWGNEIEKARAERIASGCQRADVLPRMKLVQIAEVLAAAKAIVAVDTGLGHLAAALDVPTVSLYGPTNPLLTGAVGRSQAHLSADFACSPCLNSQCAYRSVEVSVTPACFTTVAPERVWQELERLI